MKCVKTIFRDTAVLVDFCHTNFKFGGKLYPPGIPQVIPYLLTVPDFKITALFSSYSDLRYWILYTDHTVYWLYSQKWDEPRCFIRTVTIPRMVTIKLKPFLPCVNLALKNSYQKRIWLTIDLSLVFFCGHLRSYKST